MNVLKTVDASFDVEEFLDTKKKFNLNGPLLQHFQEVATDTYYCITITRHRNMSSDFLNDLYHDLNLPFDLHPIPCPTKDKQNPEKYLKFEEMYHSNSLRKYNDDERPGKVEKKSHNIPFPKSVIRARYCCDIIIRCESCGKRRVVYSKYKPPAGKVDQGRYLLENMRYQCGSSFCTFGVEGLATVIEAAIEEGDGPGDEGTARSEVEILGNKSIFSMFFIDESLCCSSPIEKHLYEVLLPSLTDSPPCFYCGETDLIRTTTDSDQTYPLCHFCRTVKKFGPVMKRKKRTIVQKQKKKNPPKSIKTKKSLTDFIDREGEDQSDEAEEEVDLVDPTEESDEDGFDVQTDDDNNVEDEEDVHSLPRSPTQYTPVDQLLYDSDD